MFKFKLLANKFSLFLFAFEISGEFVFVIFVFELGLLVLALAAVVNRADGMVAAIRPEFVIDVDIKFVHTLIFGFGVGFKMFNEAIFTLFAVCTF